MHTRSLAAAVTVFALAPLLSAQTIAVSGGGAALQQAINAAPLGATLDVAPGTYSAVAVTQGVHIRLQLGANVTPPALSLPALTVNALPAGQTLLVEGAGQVGGFAMSACAGDVVVNGVEVPLSSSAVSSFSGCGGALLFDGVTYTTGGFGAIVSRIDVTNCAQVSFTSCVIGRLVVAGSRVSLADTIIFLVNGLVPGIDIASGSVVINGGRVVGGFGASLPVPQPGVSVQQGELVATGGASIEQTPGPLQGPAIATTGGVVRLDPSVVLVGSPISGPATVQIGEIPSVAVSHSPTALAVSLTGEPGSALFTLAGLPMAAVPTPWGDAWLSPADVLINVVILSASGASGFSVPVANVPPFVTLVLQSVALTTNGSLVVGAPVRFVWD